MIIAYLALYIGALALFEPPELYKGYDNIHDCHKEAAIMNKTYPDDLKKIGGEFVCLVIKRESV